MSDEKDIEIAAVESRATTAVDSESPPSPTQGIQRTVSMGSYGRLGRFMSDFPDITIFRRFSELNVENILFLQAEISHLEERLKDLRHDEDMQGDEKGLHPQRNWVKLSQPDDDGEYCAQWELMTEIREKLEQYNSFLLQYKQMCALQNPSRHDLRHLREWLNRPECGDNFLTGIERQIFHEDARLDIDQERSSDLVTMSREAVEHDYFSRWLSDEVLDRFHALIGRRLKHPCDEETGIYHYRKRHLRAVSHLFGVVLASVIPAASIFTLYYVVRPVDRLIVLLGYSALFSVCLALFTNARRVEIFAATAAFASVQVVFVGSTISGSPGIGP